MDMFTKNLPQVVFLKFWEQLGIIFLKEQVKCIITADMSCAY